jgi:hypothetical protein
MVGDSQIGKTSLMVKYVEGSFDEDYIQTLGISFSPPLYLFIALIILLDQASILWKRPFPSEERQSRFQFGIWAVNASSSTCYHLFATTLWQSFSCLIYHGNQH